MRNKIFFSIFIMVWLILCLLNLLVPKATFSEEENRNLARWPMFTWERFVNGQYAKEVENYINDHFIFRKEWVALKTVSERAIGKTQMNGVYIGKDGYLFEKVGYELDNIEIAVENIEKLARKIGNTSVFHVRTQFHIHLSR